MHQRFAVTDNALAQAKRQETLIGKLATAVEVDREGRLPVLRRQCQRPPAYLPLLLDQRTRSWVNNPGLVPYARQRFNVEHCKSVALLVLRPGAYAIRSWKTSGEGW